MGTTLRPSSVTENRPALAVSRYWPINSDPRLMMWPSPLESVSARVMVVEYTPSGMDCPEGADPLADADGCNEGPLDPCPPPGDEVQPPARASKRSRDARTRGTTPPGNLAGRREERLHPNAFRAQEETELREQTGRGVDAEAVPDGHLTDPGGADESQCDRCAARV